MRGVSRLGVALATALALPGLGFAALAAGDHPPPARAVPPDLAMGPLRVSSRNPRYFETPAGTIVYLTGSHTWSNLQDNGTVDPPPAFDYPRYLAFLKAHGHNFFRLWAWEQLKWTAEIEGDYWFSPGVYQRTGPGLGLDGKPRVDLTRFNPAYFDRLRSRVEQAGQEGLYVSVMLFNGWSVGTKGPLQRDNPWKGHPFNRANNVNGIDGDPNHDGLGYESQTLAVPAITRLQEEYVRKVIDAVNQFDNVLYEIANEGDSSSLGWQYHMIGFVQSYEATKPKQHPVGMTAIWPNGSNAQLFASRADWVAPAGSLEDPPVAAASKVVLGDTDHLCGTCGSVDWVWESLTRGENPVLMDGYDGAALGVGAREFDPHDARWEPIRMNLGFARRVAGRVRLGSMVPRPDLASTGYCLAAPADPAPEYVVYLPGAGEVMVDLSSSERPLTVTWLDPRTGIASDRGLVRGGGTRTLRAPFGKAAVLLLH